MKNLIIIGARGFGREVYTLSKESHGYGTDYVIKGFLDDKSDALDGFDNYPPILNSVEGYEIVPQDVFVCALGAVIYKKKYAQKILDKGGEFISIIHKSVNIGVNSQIGKGCIIMNRTLITSDVKVGNFVSIHPNSILGHDVHVLDWVQMGARSFLGGYVCIKEGVTINVGSIIHPHKVVGDYSVIGAGSVVFRNVEPHTTVYGNPAKRLDY